MEFIFARKMLENYRKVYEFLEVWYVIITLYMSSLEINYFRVIVYLISRIHLATRLCIKRTRFFTNKLEFYFFLHFFSFVDGINIHSQYSDFYLSKCFSELCIVNYIDLYTRFAQMRTSETSITFHQRASIFVNLFCRFFYHPYIFFQIQLFHCPKR